MNFSYYVTMKFCSRVFLALVSLLMFVIGSANAQDSDHANSPAFKDYRPPGPRQLIHPSDVEYELWEGFLLVRKANAGDPAAQHELGLRYLLGKGFPVDTDRAAYWIGRAAEQNMPVAEYNYSIFLNNGWGLKWQPFRAFAFCDSAAQQGMPEAEYAMALYYTDDLVVQRDLELAYHWAKDALKDKYEPARALLAELAKHGVPSSGDTTYAGNAGDTTSSDTGKTGGSLSSLEPVYLDFGQDTTNRVDDLTLLNEAFKEGNDQFRKALGVSSIFEKDRKDSTGISMIEHAANIGSPEALTVLGRCYELGIGVPRDVILAAEQYLRAARMDSRHAPALLWHLVQKSGFSSELESRTKKGDDNAAFVWAGLTELGFDQRLMDDQAFQLLVVAAGHNNVPSLIELGRCYYTGQWTSRNPELGKRCWLKAMNDGSRDAAVRLAAAAVIADSDTVLIADTLGLLTAASLDGSIIAQVALGYCYEYGVGVPKNTSEAVRLYRNSAQRGSESAYDALKQMYDRIRPKDKVFHLD